MDKAGKDYWDASWQSAQLPEIWDPHKTILQNFVNCRFHEFLVKSFEGCSKGQQLLEIGCAQSATMPYFAKEFGFHVSGIDYSVLGCEKARAILKREGVPGQVYVENFFHPSQALKERFDVVISFGVAEHFLDTAKCIEAFSAYLKPGGLLITSIPNMVGLNGFLQKWLHREVYDIHVPLSKEDLMRAHIQADLEVEHCNYFLFFNLGVLAVDSGRNNLMRTILRARHTLSKIVWRVEKLGLPLPVNRITSPYVICTARKRSSL